MVRIMVKKFRRLLREVEERSLTNRGHTKTLEHEDRAEVEKSTQGDA